MHLQIRLHGIKSFQFIFLLVFFFFSNFYHKVGMERYSGGNIHYVNETFIKDWNAKEMTFGLLCSGLPNYYNILAV